MAMTRPTGEMSGPHVAMKSGERACSNCERPWTRGHECNDGPERHTHSWIDPDKTETFCRVCGDVRKDGRDPYSIQDATFAAGIANERARILARLDLYDLSSRHSQSCPQAFAVFRRMVRDQAEPTP